MNIRTLIVRTFQHYWKSNLVASIGIAVTTAVLCGGLVVGDSLRQSLLSHVGWRLGNTTHALTSGSRVFTADLSKRVEAGSGISCAPVLFTRAVMTDSENGGSIRNVQLWGVDSRFCTLTSMPDSVLPAPGEAVISANASDRLHVKPGDELLVQIRYVGSLPANTPFVSEDKQVIQTSVVVKAIAPAVSFGLFSLQQSQTAPFNVFVNLTWLNEQMESDGKANALLMDAGNQNSDREALETTLRKAVRPEDLNVVVSTSTRKIEQKEKTVVKTERVFLDDNMATSLLEAIPGAQPFITYFVNGITFNGRETPYSFVTAASGVEGMGRLESNEVVVNDWLASDLDLHIGDSLDMRYFVFGTLKTLTEKHHSFVVKGIVPVSFYAKDSLLMPYLPGLTDAGNCREWKAGIPIDLKKIRKKDEAYWNQYKGTPKAYVSLELGRELWQNTFGTYTSIIYPSTDTVIPTNALDPFATEFRLNPVLEEGLLAARSGVDFSQLFLGLGMFLIASGLLLTALLFKLSLKRREDQIQLYAALGFSKKRINRIVFFEITGVALPGALMGLFLAVGYSRLVFWGLEELWYDMIRTDLLTLHFNPLNLLLGTLAGFLAGMTTVYLSVRNMLRRTRSTAENQTASDKKIRFFRLGKLVSGILTMVWITYLVASGRLNDTTGWFVGGMFVLSTALLFVLSFLFARETPTESFNMSVRSLGRKNLKRNPWGSFSTIVLLVLSTFILLITALNRKDVLPDPKDKRSGSGGFEYVVEATIPMLYDLNDPDRQDALGMPEGLTFLQMLSAYNDDASCLNLNRITQPKILGVDPNQLEGRFSFVSDGLITDKEHPWQTLSQSMNGVIPAIVDETVMVWGLGKNVGDTLVYENRRGEKMALLLVGGLSSSVLQGHVVISRQQFERHFPEAGGSDFMLMETVGNVDNLPVELEFTFKEFGWQVTSTKKKLAEFASIENTYLNIFFLMGAFAMLLATVGLAVSILSNLLDRKKEWALLRSLGFGQGKMLRLFSYEHMTLFLTGTGIGLICSVIATLPGLLAGNVAHSAGFVAMVLLVLIINGLIWLTVMPSLFFKRLVVGEALRND